MPARSTAFRNANDDYMALRGTVTETLSPLEMSPDAENLFGASDTMAAAIRAARPSAAEGDIFTTAAAVKLRRPIRAALAASGCSVASILPAEKDDERGPLPPRPILDDRFDWGLGIVHARMRPQRAAGAAGRAAVPVIGRPASGPASGGLRVNHRACP